MSRELLLATAAGSGGMLGWGAADFFAKQTIDRIGDIGSLLWGHVCGTVVLLTALAIGAAAGADAARVPAEGVQWLGLAAFGAGQAAVYLLVYRGFAKGQVSVLSPIFASYSGLAALVSVVLLGEVLGWGAALAVALMFAGVVLVSLDGNPLASVRSRSLDASPGVPEVLGAAALAAGWTVGWDAFIGGENWLAYTTMMYLAMTIAIAAIAIRGAAARTRPTGRTAVLVAGIGLAEALAYLAIGAGFSGTSHTSVIAVLSGAFAIPTVLLARMFLRETLNRVQFAGVLAVVAAAMLLPVA